MRTPKKGDTKLSASFLKDITELARQAKYTTIQGAAYERNGNTGLSISIDKQKRTFISHPWQVDFFDYKFSDGPNPQPQNVKLTMSDGQFFGSGMKSWNSGPHTTQFTDFSTNGKQTPVRWHLPSFTAAGVGLELVAMPGSRILGHAEQNIYGQYGFAEDKTGAADASTINTGLVASDYVDEVDQPRAMVFPSSTFGKTFYLLCTFHNDNLVTTMLPNEPWVRIVETVNEENLTNFHRFEMQGYSLPIQMALQNWLTTMNHQFGLQDGGESLCYVNIPASEGGVLQYPVPTHVVVNGGWSIDNINLRLIGEWNYLIAKIHIDTNGRPFIRQRLRSDIFHYPQTLFPLAIPSGLLPIRVEAPPPPSGD